MKKILAAVAILAALSSCKAKTCTITGTVDDPSLENAVAMLLEDVDSAKALDECTIKDGSFTLKCPIDPGKSYAVKIDEDMPPVVLVPDVKKISVKAGDEPAVEGSPLSTDIQATQTMIMDTFNDYNSRSMGLLESGDGDGASALMDEMYDVLKDKCLEVYEKHLDDAVGVQALSIIMQDLKKDQFNELYAKGGQAVKEARYIKEYYDSVNTASKDILLVTAEDGTITEQPGGFGDIVGHGNYVLVDFWASWCGPCRAETPNVVAVHKKYKDQGLIVLGVPVNDELEDTKAAMKELGITYIQAVDPKAEKAKEFGVRGIPHLILFSPEGDIVQQGMRGEGIEAAVKKVL